VFIVDYEEIYLFNCIMYIVNINGLYCCLIVFIIDCELIMFIVDCLRLLFDSLCLLSLNGLYHCLILFIVHCSKLYLLNGV